MTEVADQIKVTGELLPDPNMCKFMVNRPLLDGWTVIFNSKDESLGSPLADSLFAIDGITRIKVSGSSITMSKNIPTPWPELAKFILPAIKSAVTSAQPAVSQAAIEAVQQDPGGDIADIVEQLLEQHINPALASHGGFVKLVKVEDRDVYLEMGGGCQGCAASQATMRHGVESAIREVAPNVREIIDATDHSAGINPYYR